MSADTQPMLDRSEYVEQEYLFQLLGERISDQMPIQELLEQIRHELSASTRLPMAVGFLLTEIKHSGCMAPAMDRLRHYFASFQTYLIAEAEQEAGKFDMRTALQILRAEARFRADQVSPAGLFFYQFESLCRNRLRYDPGFKAIANDPVYDQHWKLVILKFRLQVGLIDFADFLFLHSEEYHRRLLAEGVSIEGKGPFLFGEHEGKIAVASRRRDPLFLFAALQRHLGYPSVPRPKPPDRTLEQVPQLMRRVERMESRLQLLEQEQRTGIDITKFYAKGRVAPPDDLE